MYCQADGVGRGSCRKGKNEDLLKSDERQDPDPDKGRGHNKF